MNRYEYLDLRVQDRFDQTALTYDQRVERSGWSGITHALLRAELENMQAPPRRILELGAGTGTTTENILACTNPDEIVAVDLSNSMLTILKQRLTDPRIVTRHTNIEKFLADAAAAAEADKSNKFDLVVSIGLAHYTPTQRRLIAGVAEILSDGANFIFSYDPFVPGSPTNGQAQTTYDYGITIFRQDPEKITQFAVQSGLSVVRNFLYDAQPEPPPYGNPDYRGGFVVAQKPSFETVRMRPMS